MSRDRNGRPAGSRPLAWLALLAAAAGLAAGCSTAAKDGAGSHLDAAGNSPAAWIAQHPGAALPDGSACGECHGDGLTGGISGVSCFTASRNGRSCHANGPAFHPATWLDCAAKSVSRSAWHGSAFQDCVAVRGFRCEACHTPPAVGAAGSKCAECHFTTPASGDAGRIPPGSGWTHGVLAHGDFGDNAAIMTVCVNCHATHNRFGQKPVCHNCHEPFTYHPAGWSARTQHGATAKAAPDDTHGFSFCQKCHGDNFLGTPASAGVSCSQASFGGTACHSYAAARPHPPGSTWRESSAPTHRSTNTANGSVCGECHPPAGAGAFSCNSNNACHD